MSHERYEKMPKSLRKLNWEDNHFLALQQVEWIVTEKAHGANFSFVYENKQLKFAKRKAYLAWNDDFFGFQTMVQRLETAVIELFEALSKEVKADQYILFGELIGGSYPHPQVPKIDTFQAIQTGIYYAPTIEFYAFDLAIVVKGNKQYLDYEKALTYFQTYELLHATVLTKGKLNSVSEFDTAINSKIPTHFKLPSLKNNMIEGVVIKPLTHQAFSFPFRPIFKIKNKAFEEEAHFHLAQKWSFQSTVAAHSVDIDFLVEAARSYITRNRLASVVSKIGALDTNNRQRMEEIKQDFLQDVLTDFDIDNNGILKEVDNTQKKWIADRLQVTIDRLVDS